MTRDIVIHTGELSELDADNLQTLLRVLGLPHGEVDSAPAQPDFPLVPWQVRSAPTHSDDVAIDRFAEAMKAKMAAAREKGRTGWDDRDACSDFHLAWQLVAHLGKGNAGTFEDVANFAMMLHQRNADPKALAAALDDRLRKLEAFVDWVRGAQVSAGVCCCGDNMADHQYSDHAPIDEWEYALGQWLKELGK